MKIEYFSCLCSSAEHTLRVVLDKEGQLYFEPHLSIYNNFLERLVVAIKYTIGYKSKYGSFSEILINPQDKQRLLDIINKSK